MPRITTQQAAVSRPEMIALTGLDVAWTTIAEAPDYSVPDPTVRWPSTRDPGDAERRIQPGQVLFVTPLFVHNTDSASRSVEFRVVTEADVEVMQAVIDIEGGFTYPHTIAGLTLVKFGLANTNGDRLQMRASVTGVLDVTGTISIGSAEQDQPA